jgi:hypothetical protein
MADAAGVPAAGVPAAGEPMVSRRAVVRGGALVALFVYLFAMVGTAEMAPPHALVLDDPATRTFTTPACASARPADAPPLRRTTRQAAEAQGHRPESRCWRDGGFLGRGSSRLEQLLARVGLNRGSGGSRWRADGSWRW